MTQKTFALVGNQNCGKTTLFNALTGSNQYVGNWPGVTVDKVMGKVAKKDWDIVDLPGLYSLSPYSAEEVVSRNFLLSDNYDVILNIVDASHLDRSLSLTLEVAAFKRPMVIALNMIDVMEKSGISIDIKKLEERLGVPVVDISASAKKGIDKLMAAMENARVPNAEALFDESVVASIKEIGENLDKSLNEQSKIFIAQSLIQYDSIYLNEYKDKTKILSLVAGARASIEEHFNVDAQTYFAKRRYEVIDNIIAQAKQNKQTKTEIVTKAIDKIVLNKILAIPVFLMVVGLVYFGAMWFTSYMELIPFTNDEGEVEYTTITDWVNDNFFGGIVTDAVASVLEAASAPEWVSSMVLDGIVGGVGAVLGFLPQIIFLFIFLSFLEQSGYMTRVAFVLDKIFRKFGLSGRNFIPLVIATGCGVPALMAHNTIENINEKRIGLITTTFIPCSAKMPILTMIFIACFDGAWWFAPIVYGVSIFSIVATGIILNKHRAFHEEVSPFVMEVPDYHMPLVSNIVKAVYERSRAFVIKAGTLIFTVTMAVWFLSTFGIGEEGFGMVEDVDNSILAAIGTALSFIFIPVGFGSWQATVAVINGLLAKENVVGTMAVVLGLDGEFEGGEESLNQALGSYFANIAGVEAGSALVPLLAFTFMTFNLWSTPCVAALGAMKRQLGNNKWFAFAGLYMTVWAYSLAFIVYRIGGLMLGVVPFTGFTVIAFIVLGFWLYLLLRPAHRGVTPLKIPSQAI